MCEARPETTHQSRADRARFVALSDARARLGESPVWSFEHQAIWWVDIEGRGLLRTGLDGSTKRWGTPEMPGFVQCSGGQILVGMQSGIFRFDESASQFHQVAVLETRGQRFNDACTDAHGRIWAGTMDIDNARDTGVLYLFDPPRQRLTPKLGGFRTINGLAWDDAGKRLFFSDSHPSVQTVWTCFIDRENRLRERSVFARFHQRTGRPDGAMLDPSGQYWIAGVGGGTLYRFSPNGKQVTAYRVPMQSPTKPALITIQNPAIVLTSFKDDLDGGRLAIWRQPSVNAGPERNTYEKNIR